MIPLCKYCGDTGVIVPVESLDLKSLIECRNDKFVMECDYCEAIPDIQGHNKYIDNMIQKRGGTIQAVK